VINKLATPTVVHWLQELLRTGRRQRQISWAQLRRLPRASAWGTTILKYLRRPVLMRAQQLVMLPLSLLAMPLQARQQLQRWLRKRNLVSGGEVGCVEARRQEN
jgi:hypothetical protein